MIVITAPTGNIGRRVLAEVAAAGEPARVIAREPAKIPAEIRDRVEVVPGSHLDPEAVDTAFAGADTLFWLLPADRGAAAVHAAFVDATRPAIEAIRTHGIKRVVDITALGRGTPVADRAGYVTASLAMDDLIAETGVALRALAMPSFMDNVLRQAGSIKEQGVFVDTLSPDLALPTVATRDIAAVAARLLLDGTWAGQEEIPLLGPEDLSPADMAAIATDVLGRPVRYQQIPHQVLADRLTGFGMSQAMARGMIEMMTAKENGLDTGVTRTPRHAIETPTTFRQWCEDTLKPAVEAA